LVVALYSVLAAIIISVVLVCGRDTSCRVALMMFFRVVGEVDKVHFGNTRWRNWRNFWSAGRYGLCNATVTTAFCCCYCHVVYSYTSLFAFNVPEYC